MTDPVTHFVVVAFRAPGVALLLAGLILLGGVLLTILTAFLNYRPLARDLKSRLDMLHGLRGQDARRAFLEQLPAIDRRFASGGSNPALANGWAHYRGQLVETEDGVCASFIEASEAFGRLDEPARALEWWANIVVAVGLVFTFLGIVAALTEATASIGAEGATGAAAQASLLGLLAIAATKFWTSIAGVFTSIFLRVVARGWRRRIDGMEAEMFTVLNSFVDLLSPQRVLVDQLRALARIEDRLSRLETRPALETQAAA